MNLRLLFFSLCCATWIGSCSAQNSTNSIIGNWEFSDPECTDLLQFKADGHYELLNDCYATDPTNAILESGNWSLDSSSSSLTLSKRQFNGGNYQVWNTSPSLKLTILLGQSSLDISYIDPAKKANKEVWKRSTHR